MMDLSFLDDLPACGVADETLFSAIAPLLAEPGLGELCAALRRRAEDSGRDRDLRVLMIAVLDPWVADQRQGTGEVAAVFEVLRKAGSPSLVAQFAARAQALLDLAPQTLPHLPPPTVLRAAAGETGGADGALLSALAARMETMGARI